MSKHHFQDIIGAADYEGYVDDGHNTPANVVLLSQAIKPGAKKPKRFEEGRICSECKETPLNSYNRTGVCHSCQRAKESGFEAIQEAFRQGRL